MMDKSELFLKEFNMVKKNKMTKMIIHLITDKKNGTINPKINRGKEDPIFNKINIMMTKNALEKPKEKKTNQATNIMKMIIIKIRKVKKNGLMKLEDTNKMDKIGKEIKIQEIMKKKDMKPDIHKVNKMSIIGTIGNKADKIRAVKRTKKSQKALR